MVPARRISSWIDAIPAFRMGESTTTAPSTLHGRGDGPRRTRSPGHRPLACPMRLDHPVSQRDEHLGGVGGRRPRIRDDDRRGGLPALRRSQGDRGHRGEAAEGISPDWCFRVAKKPGWASSLHPIDPLSSMPRARYKRNPFDSDCRTRRLNPAPRGILPDTVPVVLPSKVTRFAP